MSKPEWACEPVPKTPARRKPRRREGRQPGTSLRWRSEKRHLEAEEREHVRLAVVHRDGGCRAWRLAPGPCDSPNPRRERLETHEVKTRGRGGSHLNIDNCIAVCQAHHDWITGNPDAAYELGLVRHSWDDEPGPSGPEKGVTP